MTITNVVMMMLVLIIFGVISFQGAAHFHRAIHGKSEWIGATGDVTVCACDEPCP